MPPLDKGATTSGPPERSICRPLVLLTALLSCTEKLDGSTVSSSSPSAGSLPATTFPPTAPVPTPQLRIANEGHEDIRGLSVIFPESEVVQFGDVPAGTVTEYRHVPVGVYECPAYEYSIGDRREIQPVINWVGENPMAGSVLPIEFSSRRIDPKEDSTLTSSACSSMKVLRLVDSANVASPACQSRSSPLKQTSGLPKSI